MAAITDNAPDDPDVQLQLTDLVYAGPWPAASSAVAAISTAIVLLFNVSTLLVFSWVALVVLSHAASILLWRARSRAPETASSDQWLLRFTLGALAIGVAWGTLAISIVAGADQASQIFLYAMVMAIMTGATVLHRADVPSIEAVLWPVSAPWALVTAWSGDVPHLALAVLLLLFAGAMSRLGRRLHQSTAQAFAWRREREQLAA